MSILVLLGRRLLILSKMKYPDIPDHIPESVNRLVGLTSLRMMGNSTIPCES